MRIAASLLTVALLGCVTSRLPGDSRDECASRAPGGFSYEDCPVGFVVGVIRDMDFQTDTKLASGALAQTGNPLILLDVEHSSATSAQKGLLLVQLQETGGPVFGREPLKTGERVLITVVRERPVSKWSCGRLRRCDGPTPESNLMGLEAFRPTLRP